MWHQFFIGSLLLSASPISVVTADLLSSFLSVTSKTVTFLQDLELQRLNIVSVLFQFTLSSVYIQWLNIVNILRSVELTCMVLRLLKKTFR